MKKQIVAAIMVAMTVAWGAEAALVTLDVDTDVDIRSKDLADTGYNRTSLSIGNTGPDPSTARCYKAYVRFKLPDDFGEATSATFTMTRVGVGAYDAPYIVHGLDDGISNETDWPDNNNSSGTTWNNAPGNVTNSPYAFINSTLAGTFTTLKVANGGVVGDSWSISGTDLVDFLNADSNGFVTLMIGRTSQSSSSDGWASSEHGTYAGPSLELEYAPDISNPVVSLLPDADADIRSSGLATNGYNRTTLSIVNNGSDTVAFTNAKAYVRFKLPSNFGSAITASFTLTRTVLGAWAPIYHVSVLNDGVSNETDWVEQDGPDGMIWNNAPGNMTNSAYEFVDSVEVGSFQVNKANAGGYVGDSYAVAGMNLVDALNADSNGYVTFMIGREGASTSSDGWASSEHPTNSWAPVLTLKYASVPAYEAWISQYLGVGAATNMTDNPDGDALNNLSEFALGGNPEDPADIGHVPTTGMVEEGGTNWFKYVYAKRINADAEGLTYSVEQSADLVIPSWVNANYEVVGTGTLDTEFSTVTNQMPTDVEDKQFLKLIIESN